MFLISLTKGQPCHQLQPLLLWVLLFSEALSSYTLSNLLSMQSTWNHKPLFDLFQRKQLCSPSFSQKPRGIHIQWRHNIFIDCVHTSDPITTEALTNFKTSTMSRFDFKRCLLLFLIKIIIFTCAQYTMSHIL